MTNKKFRGTKLLGGRRKRGKQTDKSVPSAVDPTPDNPEPTQDSASESAEVRLLRDLTRFLEQKQDDTSVTSIRDAWSQVESALLEEISLANRSSSLQGITVSIPRRSEPLPSLCETETYEEGTEVILKEKKQSVIGTTPKEEKKNSNCVSVNHKTLDNKVEFRPVLEPATMTNLLRIPSIRRKVSSFDRYSIEEASEQGSDHSQFKEHASLEPPRIPSDLDRYSVRSGCSDWEKQRPGVKFFDDEVRSRQPGDNWSFQKLPSSVVSTLANSSNASSAANESLSSMAVLMQKLSCVRDELAVFENPWEIPTCGRKQVVEFQNLSPEGMIIAARQDDVSVIDSPSIVGQSSFQGWS